MAVNKSPPWPTTRAKRSKLKEQKTALLSQANITASPLKLASIFLNQENTSRMIRSSISVAGACCIRNRATSFISGPVTKTVSAKNAIFVREIERPPLRDGWFKDWPAAKAATITTLQKNWSPAHCPPEVQAVISIQHHRPGRKKRHPPRQRHRPPYPTFRVPELALISEGRFSRVPNSIFID